jgi:pimeloyl-ACP methyl ester carboxylesterase
MGNSNSRAPLAAREQQHLIVGPDRGLRLLVRRFPANVARPRGVVMYVHGATFPSALSIGYSFEGKSSWASSLTNAGFDVCALDFQGFGGSDRYPEMDQPAEAHAPLCLAADATQQLEAAARFVLDRTGESSLSFISHSWGSMPLGLLAARRPTWVRRIVMFAPLFRRQGPRYTPRPTLPAWKLVTTEDQWRRFGEDVPSSQPPVLSRPDFDAWAEAYLDSDVAARARSPAAVKTPTGPLVEILRAWHGELAWDPKTVTAPVGLIRGEWDGLCTDEDAHGLLESLTASRERRDVKIGRGTHLMHLEVMRGTLWRETIAFLSADDFTASPVTRSNPGGKLMQDHRESKDLPGYNPGSPEVAKSPISLDELQDLKASALFTDEDMVYLRLSYDVLKDQAEDLVTMWRGIIARHTHLASYSWDRKTGEPDKAYGEAVGKRFAQWVLDTARAQYDQEWLDYQYEIGLRHHREKKNRTDGADTAPHIKGRDLIAFAAATVAPMRPYLEKGGHSVEVVYRMQEAWWKSMILQVTLWSQPYMNHGDF